MLRTVLAVALLATPAVAAEPKPSSNPSLTVGEAIGVGNALRRLAAYTILSKDKDGKDQPVSIPFSPEHPSPYRFSGDVLFAMSINIQQADIAQRAFQETFSALVKQIYGGADKVPKVGEPDPKAPEFQEQSQKILGAKSGALMAWIKRSDLCLGVKPPRCEAANPIPVDVLSALLPIIERD